MTCTILNENKLCQQSPCGAMFVAQNPQNSSLCLFLLQEAPAKVMGTADLATYGNTGLEVLLTLA